MSIFNIRKGDRVRCQIDARGRIRDMQIENRRHKMRYMLNDDTAGEEAFERATDVVNGISAHLMDRGLHDYEIFRQRTYLVAEEIRSERQDPRVNYWLTKFLAFMSEQEGQIGHG